MPHQIGRITHHNIQYSFETLRKAFHGVLNDEDQPPRYQEIVMPVFPDPTGGGIAAPGIIAYKSNGGSIGTIIRGFDQATEESLFFSCPIPMFYKEGSDIVPVVRFTPPVGGAGASVSWGVEYVIANHNSVVAGTSSFSTGNVTNSTDAALVQDKYYSTDLSAIAASSTLLLGASIVGRVFRDAAGTYHTDNYTNDAYFISVALRIQVDVNRGSHLPLQKWSTA